MRNFVFNFSLISNSPHSPPSPSPFASPLTSLLLFAPRGANKILIMIEGNIHMAGI